MAPARRDEPFFKMMAGLLLALVIAGFGLTQLLKPGAAAPLSPLVGIHGAIFLSWYVLLIVQPVLISAGKWQLHRTLGVLSILLAVSILVAGFLVTQHAYARPGWSIAGLTPAGSSMFPLVDLVCFFVAYSLAIIFRRTAPAHKRLMLLSGMLMIDPAVSRLVLAPDLLPPLILGIELGLFAALVFYDWKTRGRPHWATLLGTTLFVAAMIMKLAVAGTEWWAGLAPAIVG